MTLGGRIAHDAPTLEGHMEPAAIARLQSKEAGEAIIARIQRDFQLAPLVARTLSEQLRRYDEDYYPPRRANGQLTYLAVSQECPAGQKLSECQPGGRTVATA